MNTSFTRLGLATCCALACAALTSHAAAPANRIAAIEHIATRPLTFEPNLGQADARARFIARAPGYAVFFTPDGAVFSWTEKAVPAPKKGRRTPKLRHTGSLRVEFTGATRNAAIAGEQITTSTANYFLGHDETKWRTDVPNFGALRYREIYPGVDVTFYGNSRQLEYDFIIAPHADAGRIELRFDGADSIEPGPGGELLVRVGPRTLAWKAPVAYQTNGTQRFEVPCRFRIGDRTARFELGAYNPALPLVIDPILTYSSFLGGSDFDSIEAICVNSAGNTFVAGETVSLNFPVVSGFKTNSSGSNDVFVAKLSPSGNALVFSTYLGGSGDDFAHALDVDPSDNVFVAGMTDSPNFPVKNAFQNSLSGGLWPDGFFVKLAPAGNSLKYATYFGGPDYESVNGLSVNPNGTVYLVGETDSDANFPKRTPFQNNAGGFTDGFLAKFNPANSGSSSLIWSSWMGGLDDDRALGVVSDSAGNAFVTGEVLALDYTTSDFPVKNAMQPVYAGGGSDAFVARVTLSGSLVFATYLGGEDDDTGYAITLDNNFIYVAGETTSANFPTTNAAQTALAFGGFYAQADAFVTRFGTNGSNISYSTYLGGDFSERALGVAVDSLGFIYVGGETSSTNFPVTTGAPQTQFGGIPLDAFAVKLNPNVNGPGSLVFSTFLGGVGDDEAANGRCAALLPSGELIIGGVTGSTNFPSTTNAYRTTFNGGPGDAFIARVLVPSDLGAGVTMSPNPVLVSNQFTYRIKVANSGTSNYTAVTLTNQLSPSVSFVSATTTRGSCAASGGIVTCNFGTIGPNSNVTVVITALALSPGAITNLMRVSAAEAELNTGNNIVTTPGIVRGIADLKLSCTAAPDPVLATSNIVYTLVVQNDGPDPASSVTVTNTIPPNLTFRFLHLTQGAFAYSFFDPGSLALLIGTIPPGSNVTATITMRAGTSGPATNVFAASLFELDPTPQNTLTNIATITPVADVSVTPGVAAPFPVLTSNVTFTTVVSNAGPSAAANLTVTNILPAGVTWVSSSSTRGACVFTNGLVVCSVSSLASNQTAMVSVVAKINTTGALTNVAAASSSALDLFPTNNARTVSFIAQPLVDVAVAASASTNLAYTANAISLSARVTNRGPSTATNLRVTNALGSLRFLRAMADRGTWSASGSQVVFAFNSLATNETVALTVVAAPTSAGAITNSFSGGATEVEWTFTNNVSSVSFTSVAAPQLTILRGGTNVILSWPTSAPPFRLEHALDAFLTNWSAVTNAATLNSNRNVLTNPANRSPEFFRLTAP